MSHRYSSSAPSSNTNQSLFKVALAAAGFFTGALVGAYFPSLVLKPSTSSPPSISSEEEPGAPLCVGPECASLPPPKLPTSALPLLPPSPYESSRLLAIRFSSSTSSAVADLEEYALLLHFLHAASPSSSPRYFNPQENLPALLSHLTSKGFTISPSSLTLSSLRSLTSSSPPCLPLCRVQEGGEARWLAVVAVDAFYVYAIDLYTVAAVVWIPTREWSKYWFDYDEQGNKIVGAAVVVKAPGEVRGEGMEGRVRLVQLKLEAAVEEHPPVEIASL